MTKTAVEWLFDRIVEEWGLDIEERDRAILVQAKEMEKYQIVTAYKCGKVESNFPPEQFTTGYMYYEETFKSE